MPQPKGTPALQGREDVRYACAVATLAQTWKHGEELRYYGANATRGVSPGWRPFSEGVL